MHHEPALLLSIDPPLCGFALKIKELDEVEAFLMWALRHQMDLDLEKAIS